MTIYTKLFTRSSRAPRAFWHTLKTSRKVKPSPSLSAGGNESPQRFAIECLGLPRRAVPLSVLIPENLDGHNDAVAAEL